MDNPLWKRIPTFHYKELRVARNEKDNCFNATFLVDGKDDPKVLDLFGTATLPTGRTLQADINEVLDTLRDINPGVNVFYSDPEEEKDRLQMLREEPAKVSMSGHLRKKGYIR